MIRAEGLGKRYRLGTGHAPRSLRESLTRLAGSPFRGLARLRPVGGSAATPAVETLWALRDVSLEVRQGEVLGVIGRNGAGKSTLLKVLSRITEPTTGWAEIRGRVGSLLEVGTGFHPELTGRDNVYLNGSILGMSRSDISRRFDEIVAFAEVGRFIDTPIKHFSSGMYLRLAFAVAAHLEPEILLVDEVLAVGDAAFQRKCLRRMGDVADEGRTVLFVSHNLTAVQGLCARAIRLEGGALVEEGPPATVVAHYLQDAAETLSERVWPDPATAPGNDRVRLRRACVRPADGQPADAITTRMPVVLEFEYWNQRPGANLNLALHLYNEEGVLVFATAPVTERRWQGQPFPAGLFRDTCRIPADLLNDALHRVELLVVENSTEVVFRLRDALVFEVQDTPDLRGAWFGRWQGAVRPILEWTTDLLDEPRSPGSSP